MCQDHYCGLTHPCIVVSRLLENSTCEARGRKGASIDFGRQIRIPQVLIERSVRLRNSVVSEGAVRRRSNFHPKIALQRHRQLETWISPATHIEITSLTYFQTFYITFSPFPFANCNSVSLTHFVYACIIPTPEPPCSFKTSVPQSAS